MGVTSCCLGIDTSNYKTSVAIVSCRGEIICNLQQFLRVKKGERGLKQSDALFQHVMNLPELIEKAFRMLPEESRIDAVAVSTRPRPVEGSYMPVFNGGIAVARSVAAALKVPLISVSHQEGHIEAVKFYSDMREQDRLICFHFSGGTTEALLVENGTISIVGGSRDIAFGQVLDRIGVALGMDFPCGEEMDNLPSLRIKPADNMLPKIKVHDGFINLSGIETKAQRLIEGGLVERDEIVAMTFDRLSDAIVRICSELKVKYSISDFIFAGGVSSSKKIRRVVLHRLDDMNICFGKAELSTDNAVGVALLGGKRIWL